VKPSEEEEKVVHSRLIRKGRHQKDIKRYIPKGRIDRYKEKKIWEVQEQPFDLEEIPKLPYLKNHITRKTKGTSVL